MKGGQHPKLFHVTIKADTYMGRDGQAHLFGNPFTGVVVVEATGKITAKRRAMGKYLSYPGASGEIIEVREAE